MKTNEEYQSDKEILLEILKWVMTIANKKPEAHKPTPDMLGYIDNEDFMKMFKISRNTASNMRKNGDIAFTKMGARPFYKLSDIADMLERNYQHHGEHCTCPVKEQESNKETSPADTAKKRRKEIILVSLVFAISIAALWCI